jgi:hypothetical protein
LGAADAVAAVLRTIAAASTNSILIDILLPRRRATISNDNAVSSQQIIGQVERNEIHRRCQGRALVKQLVSRFLKDLHLVLRHGRLSISSGAKF